MAITDNETTTTPTNGKRITDEVRRDIDACTQSGEMFDTVFIVKSALLCDLDRIDEKHKKAIDDSYRDGYQEGKRDGDDEWYEEHESFLEEHGWYQALDADKQPIKFGDEVEWRHPCGSCELRHGIVTGIKTDKIGDEVFHEITVNVDGFTVRLMANQLRHHHAPTVEEVLDEFASAYDRIGGEDEEHQKYLNLIAEYAAKLRLAGSDAE